MVRYDLCVVTSAAVVLLGCGMSMPDPGADAVAELDALSERVVAAHRTRDPLALAALQTDSVVFEWQGASTSYGRRDFESRMRRNWARRHDLNLELHLSARRVDGDLAAEMLHYTETWRETPDTLTSEYGRYVVLLVRHAEREWLIDRWIGFTDSVVRTRVPR
jgi:ketosteroid isomerase-like protein